MQFGIPTLIETKSLEDCASLCKELGFDFVELNMNLPQYQIENIDVARFFDIAKSNGIYYTIHLDENLNVCDFNKKVADAYIETALQTIKISKKLEIPVINMHMASGVYFTMPNEKIYLYNEYTDKYLDRLKDFRDKCEKAIGDFNIKICIENTNGYNMEFLQQGLELLLKSNVFALTFDIGHNAGIGGIDEVVIMRRANKLYHMHIHDALGKKDHLALGTGELDLPKYFYMASKHNCRVVLETKTIEGLRQSVEWVKNRV
jgi:sugar phosphate isomerase/epimerase